jgi:phosphoribosylaminoimidazole-succinocarboxamide synthase
VREWLMDHGFQGKDGQVMPKMPDDFVELVSNRYIELYEIITGQKFERIDESDALSRIEDNVIAYLNS